MADDILVVLVWISYDIALLYLNQARYNFDAAVEAYISDERWEKEHPLQKGSKGKAKPRQLRR